jgi:hypothetical protein
MIGEGIKDIDIEFPKSAYNEGKDINSSTFKAYLTAIVKDYKGNIVQIHRQKSRSPTLNFIGLLLPVIWFNYNNSSYTIVNIGGGTYSYEPGISYGIKCISYPNTSVNCPTYLSMIQVGSGSQTNPSSATKLAAPIANGSGAGQLIYGAISLPSNVTVSGSSAYFTIAQTFNNQSGGTIDITEVGIVINLCFIDTIGGNTNFGQVLVWYDVLSSTLSVPNGGSITIYYTFTINP